MRYLGTGIAPPIPARAPAWLKRPAGVAFGFGGRLVSFANTRREINVEKAQLTIKQVGRFMTSFVIGVPLSPVRKSKVESEEGYARERKQAAQVVIL